jgi:hypothetical protein
VQAAASSRAEQATAIETSRKEIWVGGEAMSCPSGSFVVDLGH